MTAETDLLPLPEPKFLARRTASGEWLELLDASDWTAEMWVHGTDPVYSADQLRACVSSATEALRAMVERVNSWNERVSVCRDHVADIVDGLCVICALDAAEARAERLAEALRLIESAKDRGFGIDYARGVAQSALRDRDREEK